MSEIKSSKSFKKNLRIDTPSSSASLRRIKSFNSAPSDGRPRSDSISSIEELVQCAICFERFSQPRMLPCQHTFCLGCIRDYLSVLSSNHQATEGAPNNKLTFGCPSCKTQITLENGVDCLDTFPTNVYIASLLRLLDTNVEPTTPHTQVSAEARCIKCETVCQFESAKCQHCKQIFCKICWGNHMKELEEQLSTLSSQLEDSVIRLSHKMEEAEGRRNQLTEAIRRVTEERIAEVRRVQDGLLKEVIESRLEEKEFSDNLLLKIAELQKTINSSNFQHADGNQKVSIFMNLHRNTSKIIDEISHAGESRKIFDAESFTLEEDNEGLNSEVDESQAKNGLRLTSDPLENTDNLVAYYRSKSFKPKAQWTKTPRPACVAVPPWSNNIYVAATDTKMILILNPQKAKIISKIQAPELVCPHGIAFSKNRKEMYVTDKWKHCIHVFSSFGDYLRSLCSKGNTEGKVRSPEGIAVTSNDEIVVCDTGNDRILILEPITGMQINSIGWWGLRTVLNMPTSVAVTEDNKIVVADTGNHRIKVFKMDGTKLMEIGSFGRNRGQFRSAEIVAVDPLGFIFVGDAGNARIQIFEPSGSLIRVFGGAGYGPGEFKWISGLAVTPQLDIITTDHKSRRLQIF